MRLLKRRLPLPVSTMSQWRVNRSRSALVILASPKTEGHSLGAILEARAFACGGAIGQPGTPRSRRERRRLVNHMPAFLERVGPPDEFVQHRLGVIVEVGIVRHGLAL